MSDKVKITYFGTTMLLFDDGETELLFDCHVTRPSIPKYLFGKLDTDREVADRVLDEFDFSRLKGIFISHSHHDHVMDAPYFAKHTGAVIYGSPSTLNVGRGNGVDEDHLRSFDDSMEYHVGDFHIQVIPSIHSKAHWFNNDLGQTINRPITMPIGKMAFKEGGSVDFLVTHGEKKYLIRPSYNYLEGQLDDIRADVLFLGIGGLSKDTPERRKQFFIETVDKSEAKVVIPVHWDNFFKPLYGEIRGFSNSSENTEESMRLLREHCEEKSVECIVKMPFESIVF